MQNLNRDEIERLLENASEEDLRLYLAALDRLEELEVNEISFRDWLRDVRPTYNYDWPYMRYLISKLEAVERGELKRLMVFMPPRHGKSALSTESFPAWYLERGPARRVILGSYSADLAVKFSRRVRMIASSRMQLDLTRSAADDWETAQGGGVRAVGVGGGVTGMGASLLILDDVVKSAAEANSETIRDMTWDWYKQDIYTRLEPGGAIVVIMTRWHLDDLAGRILESEDSGSWEVIKFPAIAEEEDVLGRKVGDALCPARFPLRELERYRAVLGSSSFSALYQQNPVVSGGGFFKQEWFKYFTIDGDDFVVDGRRIAKRDCHWFQMIDPSATEKTTSDYTVIGTFCRTPMNQLLVVNIRRERVESALLEKMIAQEWGKWNVSWIGVERSLISLPIFQRVKVTGLPVVAIPAKGDKIARVMGGSQPRYENGDVFHLAGADWLYDFETELLGFDKAKHDDQVDVVSYACIHQNRYNKPKKREKVDDAPMDTRAEGSILARFGVKGHQNMLW